MPLQSAATAKTTGETTVIQARPALISLTITDINNLITVATTREDVIEKPHKITTVLEATKDAAGTEQIIQSDESTVPLLDVVGALTDAEYRVAYKYIPASREGLNDKVKLQVAWS